MPALALRNARQHPLTAFSSVAFLGGHDDVARAVYAGKVDVGAGHDGVIKDLAGQAGYGDAETVLKRIAPPIEIRSDPITVNLGDERRALVQQALLKAGNSDAGKAAIAKFWGNAQGLVSADIAKYEELSKALDTLQLTREDILTP